MKICSGINFTTFYIVYVLFNIVDLDEEQIAALFYR